MRVLLAIIASLVCVLGVKGASKVTEPPYQTRFGHPFFNERHSSTDTLFIIGRFDNLDRASLNLRNPADLFSKDIRFYFPDLVTPGREATLSPLGAGREWTTLSLNGRLWRDPSTNRPDLNLIPEMMIGSVQGETANRGFGLGNLILQPVEVNFNHPLTSLHHREGFYGFGPVEFVHMRPFNETSRIYVGGYFPISTGRFPPHSGYTGQTLWSRYQANFDSAKSLDIMAMDGLHKVESPYQESPSNTHRNDVDVQFVAPLASLPLVVNLYRSETVFKVDSFPAYGRETGLGFRYGTDRLNGNILFNRHDGFLIEGTYYRQSELYASVGGIRSIGGFVFSGSAGLDGVDDTVNPVADLQAIYSLGKLAPYFKFARKNNYHSPEQRFADYNDRPIEEPLEPVLSLHPNLPMRGRKIPATTIDYLEAGTILTLPWGALQGALFGWREANSAGWAVEGDSVIIWSGIEDRAAEGWIAEYRYNAMHWRGRASAIGIYQRHSYNTYDTEPPFRLQMEIGRHKFYYSGALETDFLLLGKYYGKFHSIAEQPGEPLGGGFPLEIRFTGRISRLTFHYGVHNFNNSRYRLIPGYDMMHKEEYWGIEWLLID